MLLVAVAGLIFLGGAPNTKLLIAHIFPDLAGNLNDASVFLPITKHGTVVVAFVMLNVA